MSHQMAEATALPPGEAVPARNDLFARARAFTAPAEVKAADLYPYFRTIESGMDAEVVTGGRSVVMLGSNNYLGLASHPRLRRAAAAAVEKYGVGLSGSRLLNGTLDLHVKLERKLALFHRRQAALVFSVGYLANLGVLSGLCGRGDVVVLDKLVHASMVDACRLAGVDVRRFRHNDPSHLDRVLSSEGGRPALVAVDGVYSMDGDVAPLPDLLAVCRRHRARLLVDDAHGLGVLGKTGRGTAEHFDLEQEVDLVVGTLSKATGGQGGYVVGDEAVVDFIRHLSRPLIFNASATPPAVAAALEALDVIADEPGLRARLWANTDRFLGGLKARGFDTGPTRTPIVPVQVGAQERTFLFWRQLREEGIFVNPVLPPAVPAGRCIVRATVIASHTEAQLDRALEAFERAGTAIGLIS
jgi:8-amino-7-oxononanoate synthase